MTVTVWERLKLPKAPAQPLKPFERCDRFVTCEECGSSVRLAVEEDGKVVGGCSACWDDYRATCRALLWPVIMHIAGCDGADDLRDFLEGMSPLPDDWASALQSATDLSKWLYQRTETYRGQVLDRMRDTRWLRES